MTLVAATLIMANRQIDDDDFNELWEEIKMLDIMRFAHEKGMEEGEEKGRIEAAREMVMEALRESVGVVPAYISEQVGAVSVPETLRELLRQAMRSRSLEEFEKMLEVANRQLAA